MGKREGECFCKIGERDRWREREGSTSRGYRDGKDGVDVRDREIYAYIGRQRAAPS